MITIALWGYLRSDLTAPAPSWLLEDRHGSYLGQWGREGDYGYWPVTPVPERVAAAIIAIEDRRFAYHPGVDPLAIVRALWNRCLGRERSGASTLAMQVARMQNPGPRTLGHKLIEASAAVAMTLRYGRTALLQHYLRLVPFGNGSHGIAHAARWYLDKPAEDLSWAEIAFLAAIPQSPAHMTPFTWEGRGQAIRRGHRILAALYRDKIIQADEFSLAETQIDHLSIPPRPHRPVETLHAVFRMVHELEDHTYQGDPRIQTSLDLGIQRHVTVLIRQFLTDWRTRGAEQVAAIVIDRTNRDVLAWIGSDDYFSKAAGAMDFTGIGRSPGSALKPFLYALALDRGTIAANTILADLPDSVWGIENADHDFLGPLLPRQALANSRNVPAAWLVRQIGLDEAYLFLSTLGLHDNNRPAGRYGLVLAVGALPTSLERLVRAYGALADDGRLAGLRWWPGEDTGPIRHVLSPAVARQITLFLADPAARLPGFPRLGATPEGLPIAIKTGTSQGYRDAWAVAWTSRYLVGVWSGRARGTTMRNMSGTQSSAQLAQAILAGLTGNTKSASFPAPEGFRAVELCAKTGLRSAGRCAETLVEWFREGQIPQEDNVFQVLRVDLRNGLLAAPWTPPEAVGERTFAALPPEQIAWAVDNALPPPPSDLSPLDRPEEARRTVITHEQPRLIVTNPRDGLHMLRNPEVPGEAAMLSLRAVAPPGIPQIIWRVDGQPWRSAGIHEAIHWPLSPGVHRFEVTTPDERYHSSAVSITIE